MIRREDIDSDGKPRWVLIPQVAHATLAGQLAEQWQLPPLVPAPVRDQLLSAVFHHDDGWARADSRPEWDSRLGRPLNFTEMPTAMSTEIWRSSIELAAAFGPLEVYVVAGHFHALLSRVDSWRTGSTAARGAAESFLAFAELKKRASLSAWLAIGDGHTVELAALCLRFLQFFDALSLWFCCVPRTQPEEMAVPESPVITFLPDGHDQVAVRPWPFLADSLTLAVIGSSIPATIGGSGILSGNVIGRPETLKWELSRPKSLTAARIAN